MQRKGGFIGSCLFFFFAIIYPAGNLRQTVQFLGMNGPKGGA